MLFGKIFFYIFLLRSVFTTNFTYAETLPQITFCQDQEANLPWYAENKEGFFQLVLAETAAKLKFIPKVSFVPWKRCLKDVEDGTVNGVLGAMLAPFTRKLGVFPLKNNDIDPSRTIVDFDVFFVRKKGSKLTWDGKKLTGLEGKIGVPGAYPGLIDILNKLQISEEHSAMTFEANLKMLLANRVGGVLGANGDKEFLHKSEYQTLEIMQPVVEKKYWAILFSKQYYKKNTKMAEKIWTTAAAIAKESEMLKKLKELEPKH